jgi:hypothetical protein
MLFGVPNLPNSSILQQFEFLISKINLKRKSNSFRNPGEYEKLEQECREIELVLQGLFAFQNQPT